MPRSPDRTTASAARRGADQAARRSGHPKTARFNTGSFNPGDSNTGDFNPGSYNTGLGNTGDVD
ncbi:hypothetical protein GR254_17465, partial [Mycobacterium tuberculosis]|nr:hypothetical protein [Mycobacterium tuberculosis]